MIEGMQCEQCNGAICAFCQFNQIVNNDSKTFEDNSQEKEDVF
jgi:hypothetical protein